MPNQIVQVDENMLETRLDRLVSEKVEQLLNAMLDAGGRRDRRGREIRPDRREESLPCGPLRASSDREAGTMTLKVPKLKGALFESAVIDRYRRREESVEEALVDMYLAGVSTRQVSFVKSM